MKRALIDAVLIALLGAALLLPGLTRGGLWEPYESEPLLRALDGGKDAALLPLTQWIAAAGIHALGAGELGARLPAALLGLVGLLAAYYAGRGVLSRRAALCASASLAVAPLYFGQARSLTGDLSLEVAALLAVGGLARALRRGAWWHLVIGAVGALVLATLSPWLTPLAMIGGVALLYGCKDEVRPPPRTLLAVGGVLVVVTLASRLPQLRWQPPPLGEPFTGSFEQLVGETLGFGLFPLCALLPLAVVSFGERKGAPLWPRLYLAAWMTSLVAVAFWQSHASSANVHAPLLGVAALLVGGVCDRLLERDDAQPLAAVAVVLAVVLLARDAHLFPERALALQLRDPFHWPQGRPVPLLPLVCALLAALALGALVTVGDRRQRTVALALALAAAAFGVRAHALVLDNTFLPPPLSSLLRHYERINRDHQPLAIYDEDALRLRAAGGRPINRLADLAALTQHLGAPSCAFALVPGTRLREIDGALAAAGARYTVLDAPSFRTLLVANCLPAGEVDENPLRLYLEPDDGNGKSAPLADWEGKLELVAVDYPTRLPADGQLPVTLHLRVKQALVGAHAFFFTFSGCDNPGFRRHVPLDGHLPTGSWRAGDRIRDSFVIDHLQPPGQTDCAYRVTVGLAQKSHWLRDYRGGGRTRVPLAAVMR